ncbi:hypothetical protein V8E53_012162 [Lactarius tabidus]
MLYVFLRATRASATGLSNPSNVSRPTSCPSGTIAMEPAAGEITCSNVERQDFVVFPNPNRADSFSWRLAPSDVSFVAFAAAQNDTMLGDYAVLPQDTVHIGVCISSM